MNKLALAAALTLLPSPLLATGLFQDNFNAPDSANFDAAALTGRRGGTLATNVVLRSGRVQHRLLGNRVRIDRPTAGGTGNVRFDDASVIPTVARFNFGGALSGSTVLSEGGLRIALDWLPVNATDTNWLSFCAGIPGTDVGQRVNDAGTDFGILFRNNGGIQHFNNGSPTTPTTTFPVTPLGLHRVVIELSISSFTDAANGASDVTAKAWVDGNLVLAGASFNLEGNASAFYIELGTNIAGAQVDNVVVSGLNGVAHSIAGSSFFTSATAGTLIGTLRPELSSTNPEALTYSLVSGDGDVDNAKFQITGSRLEAGAFNFNGELDNTIYSVRVRATGATSTRTSDEIHLLKIIADSDIDGIIDSYEIAKAGNLTDLNGLAAGPGPGAGTGNFDADGLTDLQEYNLRATYDLNPLLADTDGDGVSDGVEVNGAAPRPPSNPVVADTDGDGLTDGVESNTGTFVNAADPGTNAANYDTDGDLFPDGYEITRGSSPLDAASRATLPAGLTTTVLTTDEDSGIAPSRFYTHKISGGYAATVNGVAFLPLTTTIPAPDFTWTANINATTAANFNHFGANTLNGWDPSLGNISGLGLLDLFGGFTYSGTGPIRGAFQRYTLSNLTPGQQYNLKLYIRPWGKNATAGPSGRPVSLTYTNGAQTLNAYVLEDRTGVMTGTGNEDSAYYLSFPYTADGTSMTLEARVPATTVATSGSFHLYGLTNEAVGVVIADTDGDGLVDTWEIEKAGNLTDLNGLGAGPGPGTGSGNFDGDTLTDLQEYNLRFTYDLNPKAADTDGDTLEDGSELTGAGARIPTNPTKADSDGDGLSDGAESNTGTFVGNTNTGSNPNDYDTDNDLMPDGYEVARGSNANDSASFPTFPAGLTAVALTTDDSTGISATKVYTHKLSGGSGVTLNGVVFDPLRPNQAVTDFDWTAQLGNAAAATRNEIPGPPLNTWDPVAGGVTGTGLQSMLSGFTYSGNGADPSSFQTFTLSNLTIGRQYDLRLYIRAWAKAIPSGRINILTFTNGLQVYNAYVLEDRPAAMLGSGTDDSAYYLSFPYTAQATSLGIEARVPTATIAASGSFHLYGLTNEAVGEVQPPYEIADITLQTTPVLAVNLTCKTVPGATYAVDYSTDLTATGQPGGWIQLATGIASGGATTTYQDTVAVGIGARIFYRFRRL
jgi:Bacterial TSP3 repeat